MRLQFCPCLLALAAAATIAPAAATADEAPKPAVCYVIPVNGMIERGLTYVVRRGVQEAIARGADAVILDMNTPGGRLDAAEEIIHTIADLPMRTCTYVNPSAISAGAIIAMATDQIYMAPGSRIGDAMPIMMSMFGNVEPIPEAMEEKSVSYVAALIRATAERKGHDPKLAEAMVRRELEYKLGEVEISRKGELLTLTNTEAERAVERGGATAPLLSRGTAASLAEVAAKLGRPGATFVRVEVSVAEEIARWIERLSALLLIGGLLGLYIEFKTPGFGLPGIAGIALIGIWFWGHHVAGLAGMGELLVLLLGFSLLAVEIFVIPGFGFVGITGIVLIVTALLMAMVQHYPGLPWYTPPVAHIQRAVITLSVALMGSFALTALLARFLPQTGMFQRLMLGAAVSAEKGYQAAPTNAALVGKRGRAATALRPAGIGEFGGRRLDVVAGGSFVDAGTPIVIAEAHGSRIIVEPVPVDGRRG